MLIVNEATLEKRHECRETIQREFKDAYRDLRQLEDAIARSEDSVGYGSPENLLNSARRLCQLFAVLNTIDSMLLHQAILKVQP
jgi:transcription elongation factor GreA-like protein